MTSALRFLIIDGYPKKSRDEFDEVGMTLSYKLYANMLHRYLPDAETHVWLPSDTADLPDGLDLEAYDGVLWTGCNLTIYDTADPRVTRQVDLARRAYAIGIPSFGSCWGLQMAVYAAGGEVRANPKGREMGVARRIHLTDAARNHPMMEGKPPVYNGFISHDDEVTALPPNAVHLATNDFTRIQAVTVNYKRGTFWATQYHPEYDLHEVARLIVARAPKLIPKGFFKDMDALMAMVNDYEALFQEPDRKDLRWKYDIGDDLLDPDIRQIEFRNWIHKVVLPAAT